MKLTKTKTCNSLFCLLIVMILTVTIIHPVNTSLTHHIKHLQDKESQELVLEKHQSEHHGYIHLGNVLI